MQNMSRDDDFVDVEGDDDYFNESGNMEVDTSRQVGFINKSCILPA